MVLNLAYLFTLKITIKNLDLRALHSNTDPTVVIIIASTERTT